MWSWFKDPSGMLPLWMWIVATWLGVGCALAGWSYRRPPRPPQWWIGFFVIALLWPLAFVGQVVEWVWGEG
jgi:hypothetical protein